MQKTFRKRKDKEICSLRTQVAEANNLNVELLQKRGRLESDLVQLQGEHEMLIEKLTRQCMQQLNYNLPTVRLYWIDGHKFEVMHHSFSSDMLGIHSAAFGHLSRP